MSALDHLIAGQLAVFPEHQTALGKRFTERTAFDEDLAGWLSAIVAPDPQRYFEAYRWLTGAVLEEELHFRREGRYRLSSFAEAEALVYADAAYMSRYMDGLLLSQLWWGNHAAVLEFYRDRFLKPGARHLEVGPGHGLFLWLARQSGAEVEGWDISPASLDRVRETFAALKTPEPDLSLTDLFAAGDGRFDQICFSEVLEHLEDPDAALARLAGLLAPGGRLFVNAPVNSPAPDHIFLFRSTEEIVDKIAAAGLEIEETLFAPSGGSSLDRARKLSLAISAAVIARRPLA